ncbi:MAG: ankyrin repeat domain-containing protein [Acidobacteriota bacterium]
MTLEAGSEDRAEIAFPDAAGVNREAGDPGATICGNCERPLQGEFCSACGQRHWHDRLSVSGLLGDLFHRLFNFDRGIWVTIRDLTVAPGQTVRRYLDGQRRRYLNPFTYLAVTSAASILVHHLAVRFSGQQLFEGVVEQYQTLPPEMQAFMLQFMNWIMNNAIWVNLLIAGPFAFVVWALSRRSNLRLAETGVLALFAFAHVQLLGIAIYLPLFVLPASIYDFQTMARLSQILQFVIPVAAVMGVLGKTFPSFLKGAVAVAVGWGVMLTTFGIAAGIYVFRHPELLTGPQQRSLYQAIEDRRIDEIDALIASGADINAPRIQPPLHLAIAAGDSEIIDLLIGAGADLDALDSNGHPALRWAVQRRKVALIERLLAAGADPTITAPDGTTLVMLAADASARSLAPLLEVAPSLVDQTRDHRLATALMIAADDGSRKRVELLLAAGADPAITNNDSETALELAAPRVRELLAAASRPQDTPTPSPEPP